MAKVKNVKYHPDSTADQNVGWMQKLLFIGQHCADGKKAMLLALPFSYHTPGPTPTETTVNDVHYKGERERAVECESESKVCMI